LEIDFAATALGKRGLQATDGCCSNSLSCLDPATASGTVRTVCQAIQHAHPNGIHRDIKPSDVLVTYSDGSIIIWYASKAHAGNSPEQGEIAMTAGSWACISARRWQKTRAACRRVISLLAAMP